MRTFIAIFLPKEILDYLYEVENKLKKELPAKINWVAKENLHFTLKFLGQVDEKNINSIKERLNRIKFGSFKIDLDKIGVFPNEEFIRVIWIGLKSKELGDLQRLIDYELLDLFSKEQDFISHLTLGRIKNIQDKEKFKKALQIKIEDKEFEINEFCLVKSELHKEGPSYEILERFKLY
ncbi:MAG: 2'-5' RNA ligase [archaeon GW2011_AR20]|nr:MAG: 2'-5' RNA ligase [archaeon GW2011_AR20]MBS3160607.1 RNA 2',3'-cyclic phosphodiesterase [Candidatus Woesearchaeota archaeon]